MSKRGEVWPDEFSGEADDEFELDDGLGFDCHLDRNGYCGLAGSEECEFECPNNWMCKS